MKKQDIIAKYADVKNISKKDATEVFETMLGIITDGLKEDKLVDIYGFGKFTVVHKDAGTARSPKTGETVQVEAKEVPKMKFSKALKDELNK